MLWGTTYLGIRMALESFPPLVLVSTRYILSGSIMLLFARARGIYLPRGRELLVACASGVVVLGIGNSCLVFSEVFIPSGLAGLITTISPFWLAGVEAMMPRGERLNGRAIAGMLVGLGGAALLFAPGVDTRVIDRSILLRGFLLLQLGMAAWSFGSIVQRRQAGKEAHPVIGGAVQQLAAGVVLSPFALAIPQHPVHWSARGIGALVYLVCFGSIAGYSAFAYALDRLPVAVVSIYSYVNAMVAVALGWLVYREPFGRREALAMAIIFAGVTVVKRYARYRTAKV